MALFLHRRHICQSALVSSFIQEPKYAMRNKNAGRNLRYHFKNHPCRSFNNEPAVHRERRDADAQFKPVHTSPNCNPDAYRKRHYAWKVARDGKYGRLLFSLYDRPV